MMTTIRVVALAAATAFLCPVAAVAGEREPAALTETAAVAAPVTEAATATAVAATPTRPAFVLPNLVPLTLAPAERSITASAGLVARVRPDRMGVAPAATVGIAAAVPITSPLPFPVSGPIAGGVNAQAGARPLADLVAQHMLSAASLSSAGDAQFDCLARTVYFESRGEPIEGQLAVAEVVLNRVRSGRFRSTVCDVVTQRAQFSFVRGGIIPEVPRESAAWKRSVAIAHIAVNKLASINGEDSLFFHATYVHPNFGRPRIGTIGRHIFFR